MVVLILLFVILVEALYLPTVKQYVKNDTAEEIQHAICKITSKDLEATANATIFRELKGVCTSVELQTILSRIESNILQEIENIKNIFEENGFTIPVKQKINKLTKQFSLKAEQHPGLSKITNKPEIKKIGRKIDEPVVERIFEKPILLNYKDSSENLILKNLHKTTLSREQEIATYNESVIDSSKGSIYYYYWKIVNVKELLLKKEMYISSPEFLVLGHGLHLQFYPNYVEDESFAIFLSSSKSFIKKHKIYILNQFDKNDDIDSGLLFGFKGEEAMFKISNAIVQETGYISSNTMIVKLKVLLNS